MSVSKMSKLSIQNNHRSSITEFSARLEKVLRGTYTGNFVYSPLGVSFIMGMVQLGSSGNTSREIAQSLNFPEDNDSLMKNFKNASGLLKKLDKSDSDSFVLRTSQRIFIQKSYHINPEYLEKLIRIFDAGVQLMDFDDANAEKNAELINTWVEKMTEGKIKKCVNAKALIPKSPLNPLRLMLVNTIYFHGKWLVPFEALQTRDDCFYVNDGGHELWETSKVAMMQSNHRQTPMFEYVYLEKLNAEVVKLPYKNPRFSMIIFVPKFKKGLAKIQKNISTVSVGKCLEKLRNYKKEMDEHHILFSLSMPKFKFQTELNLVDSLRTVGIKDAFKAGVAEFNGITDHPDGLFVSDISQQAIIEVDELGTTAAAVTRLNLSGGGCPEIIEVKADRSFYFQIVDEELEIVIFSGALIDPNSK